MTAKRFSRLFCQLMGLVMFASLSIWSSSTFAACNNVVTNGLVACYPFDGNAQDYSGKGNHGTAEGQVSYVPGVNGSAVKFGGLDNPSDILVKNSPSLQLNREVTISVLVKIDDPTGMNGHGSTVADGWHTLLAKSHDQYPSGLFTRVGLNSSNLFFADGGNAWWTPAESKFGESIFGFANVITTSDKKSKWVHVVYVVADGVSKIFSDGVLAQRVEIGTPDFSIANTQDLYIGKYSDKWYPSSAAMDNLRIYNRALTDAEVKELYNEANPKPVVCAPANYTNGVLKVPFITIDGVTDTYKATMQQYNSGFAFRVTESAVITGKSNCPATYSPTTGILHIPLVKTKSAIPLNTFQCYDVTLQAFSDRFQLDLETLKVIKCP